MTSRHQTENQAASRPHSLRTLVLLLVAHMLALACLGYLLAHKQRSLLVELAISRAEIGIGSLAAAMSGASLAGLEAAEMQRLHEQIDSLPGTANGIAGAAMFTLAADGHGRIVHHAPAGSDAATMEGILNTLASQKSGRRVSNNPDAPALALIVPDSGGLLLTLDAAPLQAEAARFAAVLRNDLLLLAGISALALLFLLMLARRRLNGARWLPVLIILPTFIAAGLLALHSAQQISGSLQPALTAKTSALAGSLAERLAHAINLGIPADKLTGVTEYFDEIRQRNPDIAAIVFEQAETSATGIASSRAAVLADGRQIGEVWVVADADYAYRALWAIAADVAVVLLATLLAFRELLAAVVVPAHDEGNSGLLAVQSLRLPLFLFILSEELTRAFLPLFFRDAGMAHALSADLAASLPISVYMILFAATTPYAGGWADRFGPTRVFALGAALCALGFGWMALSQDYWPLLIARALCAAGYALGTMACQRQIIASTADDNRTRGLALFVSAVSIAAICGASVGGVLAERMGYRGVLLIAAGCALAGFAIFALSREKSAQMPAGQAAFHLRDLGPLLRNRRFMMLMLGAAIPAKIALAGFLFYLTPLGLQADGYSPAAIGRAIMLYYILLTLGNPLASLLADRWRQPLTLVVAGMLLTGLGTLAALAVPPLTDDLALWAGIVSLGIGTALSAAPMQTLAVQLAGQDSPTPVLVALRTLERLGSVIGPLIAGGLLVWLPHHLAMTAIGAIALAGTLILLINARQQREAAA